MPKGPKGEKRPAGVIGNAVHVMRIATGEIEENDRRSMARGNRGVRNMFNMAAPNPERRDVAAGEWSEGSNRELVTVVQH